MRRLVRHLLVTASASAVAASAAVVGLTAGQTASVEAVPVTAVAVPSTPAPTDTGAEREVRVNRGNLRPEISSSAAADVALQRSAALTKQAQAIAQKNVKLERARARAQAQQEAAARAAEKAAAARVKELGYEPGTSDPRSIAEQILKNKYGYGADQFRCFDNIIMRESRWNIHATNPSSGAYGIPQALPGSKMATVASDWRTNPATQIIWGIGYMNDRYGSPCGAWGFKSSHGWY